jgi:hypothetical protein
MEATSSLLEGTRRLIVYLDGKHAFNVLSSLSFFPYVAFCNVHAVRPAFSSVVPPYFAYGGLELPWSSCA